MKHKNTYITDDGIVEKGNLFIRYHVTVICMTVSIALIILGALAISR